MKAFFGAKEIRLLFFSAVVTLVAVMVFRKHHVHADGIQRNTGAAALNTMNNLHHKVVLPSGIEPESSI